tara:strand:- start:7781 stop:8017 length:237 start_codon:yes stop_codon:yes gene_type:complete
MKLIPYIILATIVAFFVFKQLRKWYIHFKAVYELRKFANALTDKISKEVVKNDIQNLHPVYNKNVVRGKDGRFKSKKK